MDASSMYSPPRRRQTRLAARPEQPVEGVPALGPLALAVLVMSLLLVPACKCGDAPTPKGLALRPPTRRNPIRWQGSPLEPQTVATLTGKGSVRLMGASAMGNQLVALVNAPPGTLLRFPRAQQAMGGKPVSGRVRLEFSATAGSAPKVVPLPFSDLRPVWHLCQGPGQRPRVLGGYLGPDRKSKLIAEAASGKFVEVSGGDLPMFLPAGCALTPSGEMAVVGSSAQGIQWGTQKVPSLGGSDGIVLWLDAAGLPGRALRIGGAENQGLTAVISGPKQLLLGASWRGPVNLPGAQGKASVLGDALVLSLSHKQPEEGAAQPRVVMHVQAPGNQSLTALASGPKGLAAVVTSDAIPGDTGLGAELWLSASPGKPAARVWGQGPQKVSWVQAMTRGFLLGGQFRTELHLGKLAWKGSDEPQGMLLSSVPDGPKLRLSADGRSAFVGVWGGSGQEPWAAVTFEGRMSVQKEVHSSVGQGLWFGHVGIKGVMGSSQPPPAASASASGSASGSAPAPAKGPKTKPSGSSTP